MADSDQVRTDLQIFLQRMSGKRVINTLTDKMPTLDLIAAINGNKKDFAGVGRPEAGNLSIGRINGASAPMREKLFAAREYLPIVQISKPSKADAKSMADYDNNPVVPNWDTTNRPLSRFKQPRFKLSRKKMPYKVPHSEVETAKSNASTEGQAARAVGSVYDFEVKSRTSALCELLNDELWGINGQVGYPTDEDAVTWDHFHSISQAIHESNTYGGVDRSLSANSWFRGNVHDAAFTGTFGDMIEHSNYELGLIDKGLGVQIIAVGKTLIRRAKAEAKAEGYQLVSHSIPDPEYGFKRDMVCIHSGSRRVFVYYEPAINAIDTATGKKNAFALDPSTWTIAIPGNKNFVVSTPIDLTKTTEGGDEADVGTIEHQMLICCEVPSGNAIYTDVQ